MVDDGLFDIIVMGDLGLIDVLRGSSKLYKGTHLSNPKIRELRGKKVVADSEERVLIDMDGEQPGKLPATFEIVPKAINLKVAGNE